MNRARRRPAAIVGGAVAAGIALPGAVAALHLTALSLASLLPPRRHPSDGRPRRLLVLVAARNEERLVGRSVAALVHQRRPGDIVVVIADRCDDATADVARQAGAEVIERPHGSPPGKGAAIHDGITASLDRDWDALVTVDADSVVEAGFLDACERALQEGAAAAQSRSESVVGPGLLSQAAAVAAALQGVTLPRGRSRLGLAVRLKGPGMVVRRDVLIRHPFPAVGSSEDTRYGVELVLAGIVPRHCEEAQVRSESSRRLGAASGQRLRWEAGRLDLARHYSRPLVRAASASSVEAVVHLATPPVAVAVLLLGAGTGVAGVAGARSLAYGLGSLLGLLGIDVVIALVAARAGVRTWAALAAAPAYVGWKAVLQVRALLAPGMTAVAFEPTRRD